MGADAQALFRSPNELEAQSRRRRLLPLPIRTISFSSKNTASTPTTSSPVHSGTSRSHTATTALTTPSSPPLPQKSAVASKPLSGRTSKSSGKFFRPSALKRLFTNSTNSTKHSSTALHTKSSAPTPVPVPQVTPQRPPLTRLREASSSILTYHRARILDRDLRSEQYCKVPLTQWNLDSLQTELAELRAKQRSRQDSETSSAEKTQKKTEGDNENGNDAERVVIVDEGTVRVKVPGNDSPNADSNDNQGSDPKVLAIVRSESSPSRRKVEERVIPWLEAVVS